MVMSFSTILLNKSSNHEKFEGIVEMKSQFKIAAMHGLKWIPEDKWVAVQMDVVRSAAVCSKLILSFRNN
jgi:hypothetical protein